jgi:hypothetical protein
MAACDLTSAPSFGEAFAASGWGLTVTGLPPSRCRLVAYSHSAVSGAFDLAIGVSVSVF